MSTQADLSSKSSSELSNELSIYTDYVESPLGVIEFKASNKGIFQTIFCGKNKEPIRSNNITEQCKKQLIEYFDKKRTVFELPLDPQGTTFQKSVWNNLLKIPFGEVATYLEIAKMVGKPKGSQAVGGANGRNPISLIIPCHRVIGSNGSLTGYAGGIERKLWLLKHEGVEILPSEENDKLNIDHVIGIRQSKTEFLK